MAGSRLWDFCGDNYDILMTPISPNRFMIPGTTLEFSPAEAGRPQAWHIIDGEGRRLLELPLMKFDMSKADLGSFAGAYRSDELDVTYTVAVRDSSLVVQSSTLHPVFKDAFVGEYVGTVRFLRDRARRCHRVHAQQEQRAGCTLRTGEAGRLTDEWSRRAPNGVGSRRAR